MSIPAWSARAAVLQTCPAQAGDRRRGPRKVRRHPGAALARGLCPTPSGACSHHLPGWAALPPGSPERCFLLPALPQAPALGRTPAARGIPTSLWARVQPPDPSLGVSILGHTWATLGLEKHLIHTCDLTELSISMRKGLCEDRQRLHCLDWWGLDDHLSQKRSHLY